MLITATDLSKLANIATSYVCRCGEGHEAAPVTPGVAGEIKDFDGSTASEDRIWAHYRAAFEDMPASDAFLSYANEQG